MNQWSASSRVNSGAMSNRFRYLFSKLMTPSRSFVSMGRSPFVEVFSGSAYLRTWYWGLLPDGSGLKPHSYSFCQLMERWK